MPLIMDLGLEENGRHAFMIPSIDLGNELGIEGDVKNGLQISSICG